MSYFLKIAQLNFVYVSLIYGLLLFLGQLVGYSLFNTWEDYLLNFIVLYVISTLGFYFTTRKAFNFMSSNLLEASHLSDVHVFNISLEEHQNFTQLLEHASLQHQLTYVNATEGCFKCIVTKHLIFNYQTTGFVVHQKDSNQTIIQIVPIVANWNTYSRTKATKSLQRFIGHDHQLISNFNS